MSATSYQDSRLHQSGSSNGNALNAWVETVPAEGSVALRQEQHLRLRDALGWTIKAVSGTIWITQESDSRDIVLKAGDSFVLDRPGSTLVSPLGDAKLCLKRENLNRSEKASKAASKFLPSFSTARALFA
ncbi:MAG: DUF2917 domain-containing protein [Burkholderiaceae bacterium]